MKHTRLLACAVAVLAAAACSDPNAVDASFDVNTDTLAVYALNNSQGVTLNAVELRDVDDDGAVGPVLTTVAAAPTYDVALDIAPGGEVIVYPANLVTPGVGRFVGLLESDQAFDAITMAPREGYETDAPVLLAPGEVVLIQSANPSCRFDYQSRGAEIYGKLVVDSVQVTPVEKIFVRVTSDPNCGFRSLAPGRPRD